MSSREILELSNSEFRRVLLEAVYKEGSVKELAVKMNVSSRVINRWLAGSSLPNHSNRVKLFFLR